MWTRVVIVLTALGIAFAAVLRADRAEDTPLRMSFAAFPMTLGEWHGVQLPPFEKKILDVLGLDDYINRRYDTAVTPAHLYVGYWKSQRQGDTMHSPQNCLPGSGWTPVSDSVLTIADPRGADRPPISVNRYIIQKGLDKQLVLYWYQGRGRIIGNEYWSKAYLMWDAAWRNRTDAAIVRIVVPIGRDAGAEAAAERYAVSFANQLIPALALFLPE
jgi:EpsI family protein